MKKTFLLGAVCSALLLSNTAFAEFKDVEKDNKYYKEIEYVENAKIFSGTSEETFSPNDNITRAMMVQIIYNMNKAIHYGESYYTDVETDKWYNNAITWARFYKIANGRGDNIFAPDALITKQELVTLLYNYAKYKNYDVSVGENTNILSYEDAFNISEYAYEPFVWACGAHIIETDNSKLNYDSYVTRAEVAFIIKNFSMKYMKESVNVSINGNVTTGYVWYPVKYDKNVVFIEDYEYVVDNQDTNLVGTSGKFNFKVSALNPGKTRVIFKYKRPWEEKAINTIVCMAEVNIEGELLFSQQSDESSRAIVVKSNSYNKVAQEDDYRILRNRRDLILYVLEFEISETTIPSIKDILINYTDEYFEKNILAVITKQEKNGSTENKVYKVNAVSDNELEVYINRIKGGEKETPGASWHIFIELPLEKYPNINKILVNVIE